MKKDIERWMDKAEEDLDTAKYNFNGNKFEVAAFFAQQAAEKSLKALLLKKTGKTRKIHDLVQLGKDVELPENLLDDVKELTLAYIYSRYPDIEQKLNLKKKASHFLEVAMEVLRWTKENL